MTLVADVLTTDIDEAVANAGADCASVAVQIGVEEKIPAAIVVAHVPDDTLPIDEIQLPF